jgi:hypothetical protein
VTALSPVAEQALRSAGWYPGRSIGDAAVRALIQPVSPPAGAHVLALAWTPTARDILDEFGGLTVVPTGPGVDLRPRPFRLDPGLAAHAMDSVFDVARVTDRWLAPLGVEDGSGAVLAVTGDADVLAIDATGVWYLGRGITTALDTLISGRRPARVTGGGDWPGRTRPTVDADPAEWNGLGLLDKPVGVAFFVTRTPDNPYRRWLPQTLRRLGLTGPLRSPHPPEYQLTWAGLGGYARVLDLDVYDVLLIAVNYDHYVRDVEHTPDARPVPAGANAVAAAFRQACAELEPDLQFAISRLSPVPDLEQWIAGLELDVIALNVDELLDLRAELTYLADEIADHLPASGHQQRTGHGRVVLRSAPDEPL